MGNRISRFNPTTNGPLHLGHIYNLLVMRAESDVMKLRYDDDQIGWVNKLGEEKIKDIVQGQDGTMAWLGFKFNDRQKNSDMAQIVRDELRSNPHYQGVDDHWIATPPKEPIVIAEREFVAWAPHFFITAQKVILDRAMSCNYIVRGHEFIQENSLYLYFCCLFGYPVPQMVYIPRLLCHDGKSISKTAANWQIRELRDAGFSPMNIFDIIRVSCLKDPYGPFTLDNLNGSPHLPKGGPIEVLEKSCKYLLELA